MPFVAPLLCIILALIAPGFGRGAGAAIWPVALFPPSHMRAIEAVGGSWGKAQIKEQAMRALRQVVTPRLAGLSIEETHPPRMQGQENRIQPSSFMEQQTVLADRTDDQQAERKPLGRRAWGMFFLGLGLGLLISLALVLAVGSLLQKNAHRTYINR